MIQRDTCIDKCFNVSLMYCIVCVFRLYDLFFVNICMYVRAAIRVSQSFSTPARRSIRIVTYCIGIDRILAVYRHVSRVGIVLVRYFADTAHSCVKYIQIQELIQNYIGYYHMGGSAKWKIHKMRSQRIRGSRVSSQRIHGSRLDLDRMIRISGNLPPHLQSRSRSAGTYAR